MTLPSLIHYNHRTGILTSSDIQLYCHCQAFSIHLYRRYFYARFRTSDSLWVTAANRIKKLDHSTLNAQEGMQLTPPFTIELMVTHFCDLSWSFPTQVDRLLINCWCWPTVLFHQLMHGRGNKHEGSLVADACICRCWWFSVCYIHRSYEPQIFTPWKYFFNYWLKNFCSLCHLCLNNLFTYQISCSAI